jgi:ABC-type lipoprotein export system ATPase subunit
VFADDSTGVLDLRNAREVLALLRELVDSLGQTVVMVTHDAGWTPPNERSINAPTNLNKALVTRKSASIRQSQHRGNADVRVSTVAYGSRAATHG